MRIAPEVYVDENFAEVFFESKEEIDEIMHEVADGRDDDLEDEDYQFEEDTDEDDDDDEEYIP